VYQVAQTWQARQPECYHRKSCLHYLPGEFLVRQQRNY
jgi:hypothetical protein